MGKSYDFTFSDVKHTRTGTMICEKSGKPIIEGTYLNFKKSYKGDWKFINYHLNCALTIDSFRDRYEKFIEKNDYANKLKELRDMALSMIIEANEIEIYQNKIYIIK